MSMELVPGVLVRNPAQPQWGLGEVQSAIGDRVTVNFEHAGKLLIKVDQVGLEVVNEQDLSPCSEGPGETGTRPTLGGDMTVGSRAIAGGPKMRPERGVIR